MNADFNTTHVTVPTLTAMRPCLKSHTDLLHKYILSKTYFHMIIYLKDLLKNTN